MTSNNYKQKATGHVTSLANGHFTGSDTPFMCEIPTASSNIYIFVFPFFHWTRCGDACRLCSNEGTFQAFTLVWQTARNRRLHKAACTPQTAFVPFLLLLPVSGHLSRGFTLPASTYQMQSPGFPKIVCWQLIQGFVDMIPLSSFCWLYWLHV